MKKIDLHIHTISTVSDSYFEYSLEVFRDYVRTAGLNAVAVTNHNTFDADQFRSISAALGIPVFPGIEVDVADGHVLVLAEPIDIDDFEARTAEVETRITRADETMSIEEFKRIFPDLNRYLVIPHTDKAPKMDPDALEYLSKFACAGEVDSQKKFLRAQKNDGKLAPVLFSDIRIAKGLSKFPSRQTYVDCGTITLASLNACLRDKAKVQLSEADGNRLMQAFAGGPMFSTGLNVLIGARSSGKTFNMDEVYEAFGEDAKYIRQFQLVQHDDVMSEEDFISSIEGRQSAAIDDHLQGLKRVVEDVIDIDLAANDKTVQTYVDSLVKAAEDVGRRDVFSKAALFDEEPFPLGNTDTLTALINSVRQVIENEEFRPIIERHIDINSLRRLALELIDHLRTNSLQNKKKRVVNGIVKDVRQSLRVLTAAVQVEPVDFYKISMDKKRIDRFCQIVNLLKREAVIFSEDLHDYRTEGRRSAFNGAMEVRRASRGKLAFKEAFDKYSDPYEYLGKLRRIDGLPRADFYKLFVKVSCRILNKDGAKVSGGERSEFRLLQEISDAQRFEILLVDEPESSFDNVFLRSNVNKLIKAISEKMPVIVVTHNNSVGASIGADYILHTVKLIEGGKPIYRIYSGHPGDVSLSSSDGHTIPAHRVILDSLEGGVTTYEDRKKAYEAIKN